MEDKTIRKMLNNGTKKYIGISDAILSGLCRAYVMAEDLKQNNGQAQAYFKKLIEQRIKELKGM
jgi:hypothetical protein